MSKKKEIVIIDNHDSFTYNLYQIFDEHPNCNITVVQSDEIKIEELKRFDKLVLSPGPDVPMAYPILFEIIKTYENTKPILGVCLGHQTIGIYYGAELYNLSKVYHGQQNALNIVVQDVLFESVANNSLVGLYHSWALKAENFPPSLIITAYSNNNIVMAFKHRTKNIRGIQFHPESYMTVEGRMMLNNWIDA